MRIRKKEWARPELNECGFFIANPEKEKGSWQKNFGKKRPIHLDLGCGKGVFLAEIANANRETNFIGIDISFDILGVCRRNISAVFEDETPDNVAIFSYNIEKLTKLFAEDEKISRIYVNFCNPWGKARAHKKRLTYTTQLESYKKLLADDGEIWFKTDNDDLYLSSLRYFKEAGLDIFFSTDDLHAHSEVENIRTEHENMFTEQGIKTKAIRARLPK